MAAADDLVDFHGRMVPRSYADHIRALVDAAPPLTVEQREKLRVLLRPANSGHHTELPAPSRRNRGHHRPQ